MKEDWKECKLGEVCEKITDGSHFSPKDSKTGYPMFSVKDMLEYGFDYTNCKYISEDDFQIMQKNDCVPQQGDILVAKDGSFLKQIFVCKETRQEAVLSSIAIFRPNKRIVMPIFLCYLLKSPKIYNYIALNCVSGSALPRIVLKDFKNVNIPIPPLATQQKIAAILSSLDDKIELNNKINDNLEQQAQAIYDELFNNDDRNIILGDIIETTSGGTPSRKNMAFYTNGNYCWVKSKELQCSFIIDTEEKITDDAINNSAAKLLPKNSVLIAMYGATVGAYGIISKDMTCNQAICALLPNENYPYSYLFMFAKNITHELENLAVGSAQQNISQVLIKKLKVHSDINKIKEFHSYTHSLFEKKLLIEQENKNLSSLRDTLLPKLMNGEIEVDEVKV